jgi:hypothetical protein
LPICPQPYLRDVTALNADGRDYTQGLDDGVGGGGGRLGVLTELGPGPRVDREVAALVENVAWIFEPLSAGMTPATIPFEPHDITCADRFYQVRALAEITVLPENSQRAVEVIWSWSEPAQAYTATKHYQDYL